MNGIQPFSIPRCYFSAVNSSVISFSLQSFGDASTGAYAAVIYLKLETRNRITLRFLASKTRIAPVHSQIIPRLELLAALLLAKFLSTISHALELELSLDRPSCQLYTLLSSKTKPLKTVVNINGKEVEMEVDTEASVSVMTHTEYKKLWSPKSRSPLHAAGIKLKKYTGWTIKIYGTCEVVVNHQGDEEKLPLVIVESERPNLLRRDWLIKLKLDLAHDKSGPSKGKVNNTHCKIHFSK